MQWKLTVANVSPGVYHINKKTFLAQIIVTTELPSEENLYLHCLTNNVWNGTPAECLAEDYRKHQDIITSQKRGICQMEQLAETMCC